MSYYQDINGGIDVAAIDTNELSRLFEQAHYEGKQFDELDPDSSAYPRERNAFLRSNDSGTRPRG
jgi:hypothetical protein